MFLTCKRGEICMKNNIENRVYLEADFIIKNKCTIRSMVKVFNVSKTLNIVSRDAYSTLLFESIKVKLFSKNN